MSAGRQHDPDGRYHVQRYVFDRKLHEYVKTEIVKARSIALAWSIATRVTKEDGVQPDIIDSTSGDYIA